MAGKLLPATSGAAHFTGHASFALGASSSGVAAGAADKAATTASPSPLSPRSPLLPPSPPLSRRSFHRRLNRSTPLPATKRFAVVFLFFSTRSCSSSITPPPGAARFCPFLAVLLLLLLVWPRLVRRDVSPVGNAVRRRGAPPPWPPHVSSLARVLSGRVSARASRRLAVVEPLIARRRVRHACSRHGRCEGLARAASRGAGLGDGLGGELAGVRCVAVRRRRAAMKLGLKLAEET
nr:unnamed protein product [Digitaria exilis]